MANNFGWEIDISIYNHGELSPNIDWVLYEYNVEMTAGRQAQNEHLEDWWLRNVKDLLLTASDLLKISRVFTDNEAIPLIVARAVVNSSKEYCTSDQNQI